ncbi:RNase A-like domain-containing protein [Nocardioides coralli]|uniref:RNase A-like domain-containing protein n=1 Tax=Nocardioides coralli TaxID=2872154 RepID=UPI001CA421DB|nr:RNase A-like domain-containing protein [Nocardioides coralli]QZY29724.1 hypothetical protein K6T13_03250 [Nocardioides coralli]
MILDVEAGSYVAAADAFRTGNHAVAEAHDLLVTGLAPLAGMAGDDASGTEFAAAYDGAADELLAGVRDAVTAFATLGRLTRESADNHRRAEARSLVGGSVVVEPCAPVADDADRAVLPTTLPTSLGGDLPALTPQQAWVLDHLEGFVWPDADVAALRAASAVWRRIGGSLRDAAGFAGVAATTLESQRSPEIPLAVDAASDLRATVDELADSCFGLGVKCEAYADAVEVRRAEVLALVHEVLRLVVEGVVIGAALAAVTAGAGAAVGLGAIAARVAKQSPRFLAVLASLRSTTSAIAASVRATRASVATQRARLDRFLGLPTRTEAGHLVLGPARWRRGWLRAHERGGGHTISKHVGQSEAQLAQRRAAEGLPYASSFRNQDEAETFVAAALRGNAQKVDDWMSGGGGRNLLVSHDLGRPVGISVGPAGPEFPTGLRVILRKDAGMPDGFRVVTGFPHPVGR